MSFVVARGFQASGAGGVACGRVALRHDSERDEHPLFAT
jgi:hypothetical protein